MAAALVIEDGTGVANANTYVTTDELRAYAANRGVTIASGDPDAAIPLLIVATDYIESLRYDFIGREAFPTVQGMCWPRILSWTPEPITPPLPIPNKLKNAQCQLVLEQLNGITLMPSQAGIGVGVLPDGPSGPITVVDGRFIIDDKLDVIETKYSEKIGTQYVSIMPAVDALLAPLMLDQGRFFTTVRL